MGKADLRVDWATHEAAKYAVEKWHYSGCLPVGKNVRVGIWEDLRYIGCVIFSRGASPHLGAKYNLGQDGVVELARVALDKHRTPVSRIVRISLLFLQRVCPGIRLVVSFADAKEGHHGGIYQAGNWLYTGTSNPVTEYYHRGRWLHTREMLGGAFGGKPNKKHLARDCKTRVCPGKHRYLMPLDNDMRVLVASMAKEYPKRVGSIDVDAPGDQSGEGGSNPTPTLQED